MGIVPADEREPRRPRDHCRIVDGSHFLEFKASFDRDTLCGHARIDGHRVGIIANNGPIQPTGSVKAAQFIQLCDQAARRWCFAEHHGLHGRRAVPSARQQDDPGRGECAGAQVHHRGRRLVRRGQLRHVRARV